MEYMETGVPDGSADGDGEPTSLEHSAQQNDYNNGFEGNYESKLVNS